jgi:D-alanyl-D-alanine carboxypeptidase/D-alanyl-D-alanine-endopeptidase (penicillin-binding protein 4)
MLLASTAKIVTSLAAIDLLGPAHRWPTRAYATAPVIDGRLRGDLVISGGPVGLTGNELRRWFLQLREEGLQTIFGNIVLVDVALLHEREPKQVKATEEERALDAPLDARTYNLGKLVVSVRPGPGERAAVTVKPRPANVLVVNDVMMGGGCAAWASWKQPEEIVSGPPLQLWVRGRWRADCAGEDIAYVKPPSAMRLEPELGAAPAVPVAARRWSPGSGPRPAAACAARGRARVGRAAAAPRRAAERARDAGRRGAARDEQDEQQRGRAQRPPRARAGRRAGVAGERAARDAALRAAQQRMRDWLRGQGLRDGDVTIAIGSGQSRAERGRPRALVELLRTAWRSAGAQVLLDSLPIAGVDGTLVHRMTSGAATGRRTSRRARSRTRAPSPATCARRAASSTRSRSSSPTPRRRAPAGARRARRVDRDRRLTGGHAAIRARCRARR